MTFGSVKEWILELLDGRPRAFRAEILAGQLGAHLEPKACGSLESFKKEDPMSSSCLLESEGSFAPCPQDGWGNSGGGSQDSFRCFCGYDIFVFFWVVIRDLYCVGIFAWVWVNNISG